MDLLQEAIGPPWVQLLLNGGSYQYFLVNLQPGGPDLD